MLNTAKTIKVNTKAVATINATQRPGGLAGETDLM